MIFIRDENQGAKHKMTLSATELIGIMTIALWVFFNYNWLISISKRLKNIEQEIKEQKQ